jgi:hypothetical protein
MFKLLAASTLLAALTATSAQAVPNTLPKEMLGRWCPSYPESFKSFKRGNCKGQDNSILVKPNLMKYWEDGCTFNSITPRTATGWSYNSRGKLEAKYYRVFEVKAKCAGEGENWNATIFLSYYGEGNLNHESFTDNELPSDLFNTESAETTPNPTKKFCSEKNGDRTTYYEGECVDSRVTLYFEKDRYTISYGGEGKGFCRFASIRTVWDSNISVATKSAGGPVTYIAAACPKGNMNLKLFNSKGSWYLEEVK